MTTLDAEKLILKLEEDHKLFPVAFRFRVWLLIMLGYLAVHLLWICGLILLGVIGWVVYDSFATGHLEILFAFKFILVAGFGTLGLLLIVFRLLFYQPKLPNGFEITGKDAPKLFALLEEVRQKSNSNPFSHVYLNTELNAAVVYLPSLMGLLPGETNLLIGLPLLAALNVEETKAILAHETGHLRKGHGSFGAWVNRNRLLWMGLGTYMEHIGGLLSGPACAFFRWYVPMISAYSLVSSREFEYQADRLAVEVAGKAATGRALLLVHALGMQREEQFRDEIREKTRTIPKMPSGMCREMLDSIQATLERGDLDACVTGIMAKRSDIFSSHPSLANRLAALEFTDLPSLKGQSESGLSLLEESWPVILPLGEHVMREEWEEKWAAAHAEHLKNYTVLERSNSKDKPPDKWNHQEVLEYVKAACRSADYDHAWQWAEYYIGLQPEDAMGYLIRGKLAMERHHESCLPDFRKAAVLSPKFAHHAYRMAIAFSERYAPHLDPTADREALHQAELRLAPGHVDR